MIYKPSIKAKSMKCRSSEISLAYRILREVFYNKSHPWESNPDLSLQPGITDFHYELFQSNTSDVVSNTSEMLHINNSYRKTCLIDIENGSISLAPPPPKWGPYQCRSTVQRSKLIGSRRRIKTSCLRGDSNPDLSQQSGSTHLCRYCRY